MKTRKMNGRGGKEFLKREKVVLVWRCFTWLLGQRSFVASPVNGTKTEHGEAKNIFYVLSKHDTSRHLFSLESVAALILEPEGLERSLIKGSA